MAVEYKVLENYGTVADREGFTVELKLISWGGNPAKYDLRVWKGETPYKGVVFAKEDINKLKDVLSSYLSTITEEAKEPELVVDSESSSESKDVAPISIEEEMKILGSLSAMNPPVDAPKVQKVETSKVDKPKVEEKKSAKIVEFPKAKPEIQKIVTEGSATYEECVDKLNKEREIFQDSDSQYVIDGLLELCKVDQNFRNNVMRNDKSYGKAFEYFADMARQGYAMKYGSVTYLDNDSALGMAIDYFNSEEKKPEPKKTTTTKVETTPKKRGRKKKEA